MNSPENAIFTTSEHEDRVHDHMLKAMVDRTKLCDMWRYLDTMVKSFRSTDVTLCDAGCVEGLIALVETLKPHSRARVKAKALETAWGKEPEYEPSGVTGAAGGERVTVPDAPSAFPVLGVLNVDNPADPRNRLWGNK